MYANQQLLLSSLRHKNVRRLKCWTMPSFIVVNIISIIDITQNIDKNFLYIIRASFLQWMVSSIHDRVYSIFSRVTVTEKYFSSFLVYLFILSIGRSIRHRNNFIRCSRIYNSLLKSKMISERNYDIKGSPSAQQ